MKVAKGLEILHCTSDILGISESDGQLKITLLGDRDLAGEIVFEGADFYKIKSAIIDVREVKMTRDEKRVAFNYSHKHKEEFVLAVTIQ
jgi:hypothetical protein